ncbi:MAG: TetR/AcrR family transcriptional regulator [Solirubrobacteraceae bacterium]|nr:TetR/AcrR family transcriptional regulator [Solirubrobacteraceae bacterium]
MADPSVPDAPLAPAPPSDRKASTKLEESIFAATQRLMEEQAFGDLSVAQILKEAEVSRATFYYYFSSKFTVLVGLLDRAMEDVFATVQPFLLRPSHEEPRVALERSLSAVTDAWRRHRVVLQATNHHWHAVPELRALWLQIVERFVVAGAEEIEREREAGLLQTDVPGRELAAALFWGTERVLYVAGLGVEGSFDDESSTIEALVSMWVGTLYGR